MLKTIINALVAFVAVFVAFQFADSPLIAALVGIGAFVAVRFAAALAVTGTILLLVNKPE